MRACLCTKILRTQFIDKGKKGEKTTKRHELLYELYALMTRRKKGRKADENIKKSKILLMLYILRKERSSVFIRNDSALS